MDKIPSFTVDHLILLPGIYISRVDGDITTYDMRTRRPNYDPLMDAATIHSFEHLFATFVRFFTPLKKQRYFLWADGMPNRLLFTCSKCLSPTGVGRSTSHFRKNNCL